MMTGNGVMHNGTTILDEYGHNLDRLKVNDVHFLPVTLSLSFAVKFINSFFLLSFFPPAGG